MRSSAFARMMFAAFLTLALGCGGEEEGAEKQPSESSTLSQQPASVSQGTTRPPSRQEVNFASVRDFPDVQVSVSGDLEWEGHHKYPVMEGGSVLNGSGRELPARWVAPVPATYEIELPSGAHVARVEVEGVSGSARLRECVVLLRTKGGSEWKRPGGLQLDKTDLRFEDQTQRFSFVFEETEAAAVMVAFATGSEKFLDRVHVSDIDVFGFGEEPSP